MTLGNGNIHKEHRKRVKDRFRSEDLDHFDPVHVLELLLFYGIPQGDTNPLAHRLLDRFGSFAAVLEATPEELEKVPGVGEHVSTLLMLTKSISRYYMVSRDDACRALKTTTECGDFLVPYFLGRRDETLFMLCLDSKCKVLCCKELAEGSVNSVGFSVRKVVEAALAANATSVVLAHNHPSGLAVPSQEDIWATRRLGAALDAVGIILADHFVISENEYISLASSGLYKPEECRLL